MKKEKSHPCLSAFAERIVGQSMFQILAKAQELERQGKSMIHFEIGDTYLEMPRAVKDRAIESLNAGRTHYGSSQGEYGLLLAIQKATHEDYAFKPELSQITVASGANPFIYYALSILANPGDEVILTDPSFVTYNAVLSMLEITGVRVPITHTDNFRFNPAEVEKSVTPKTRVIVINSPSNPTGAVASKDDIMQIYELAKKHNLYILSDEIYAPYVYEGEHFSPGVLDACRERVLVTNGFSKPFAMTGWRVGYCVGPEEIITKMTLLSQTIVSCVPPFLQDACVTALENRHEFTKIYYTAYKNLREIACEELGAVPQFEFAKPQGAFYLMMDVSKTGMDGDAFATFAMENEGAVVCPGSGFGPGGKKYVRICYARTEAELREGCRRLRRAAERAVHTLHKRRQSGILHP